MTIELERPTATEQTRARYPDAEGYFGLRHHLEQNLHVRHRPDRYRAGRCMDFEQETPHPIAAAIAETIGPPLEGKGRRPQTPRPSRPSAAS